jgi:fibrillarin-like pre-rRNA processing protein
MMEIKNMTNIEIREHPKFRNVYVSGSPEKLKLYTKNLVSGETVYGERLINYKGMEYREWDPFHSKLAALILENPITNFLNKDIRCLYLGASTGTTVSHLSDILDNGIIYAIEFAERSMRQLIQNTSKRSNIIPILGDAREPPSYSNSIFTDINLIYQDVSQPNQAEIAIINANYYLNKDGLIILAIKSQSIDSVSKSEKIYRDEKNTLENYGFKVLDNVNIHKYAANHVIFVVEKAI